MPTRKWLAQVSSLFCLLIVGSLITTSFITSYVCPGLFQKTFPEKGGAHLYCTTPFVCSPLSLLLPLLPCVSLLCGYRDQAPDCYNPCSDFGKEAFPPFYCSKDILHLPLLRGTYSWTVYIFFCDLIIFFHVNYLCIPIKLCIYCIPTEKNMRVVCKGICTSINTHLEGIKEQQKQITIVDYIQYK